MSHFFSHTCYDDRAVPDMMASLPSPHHITTFARWRPLSTDEQPSGQIGRDETVGSKGFYSIRVDCPGSKRWESTEAFTQTFDVQHGNAAVFDSAVSGAVDQVLKGASCTFFAYGHSGSGKTHTVVGYDFDKDDELGMCLAAARRIFDTLDELNKAGDQQTLGVGFSIFELRKNVASDLLNEGKECHVRQGPDGKVHVRGETEMLENGKVRVQPIAQRPCWTFDSLKHLLQEALDLRAVGTSSVHSQSSRTHAVMELEIINTSLMEAREAVVDRQSELVPVGKHATDVRIEEHYLGMIQQPDGGWVENTERPVDQKRIDAAMAEMTEYEGRVEAAEKQVQEMMESPDRPVPLGGKFVFVDLAGAEYQQDKGSNATFLSRQTAQEKREGRQINTDLLALKEVIRAVSSKQKRIPFRSSPLTMVLRDHFLGSHGGTSAMIVTLSPAASQYAATLNSLKYGNLIGAAAA